MSRKTHLTFDVCLRPLHASLGHESFGCLKCRSMCPLRDISGALHRLHLQAEQIGASRSVDICCLCHHPGCMMPSSKMLLLKIEGGMADWPADSDQHPAYSVQHISCRRSCTHSLGCLYQAAMQLAGSHARLAPQILTASVPKHHSSFQR